MTVTVMENMGEYLAMVTGFLTDGNLYKGTNVLMNTVDNQDWAGEAIIPANPIIITAEAIIPANPIIIVNHNISIIIRWNARTNTIGGNLVTMTKT